MYTVSIEEDARYAYDEDVDGFVEICPECGKRRPDGGEPCACGNDFVRKKRGFWVLRWKGADIKPEFPMFCPHCLGKPESTASWWNVQYTGIAPGGVEAAHVKLEVPVCRKVVQPIWWSLAMVGSATLLCMFCVLTAIHIVQGRIPWLGLAACLLFGAATVAIRRERTWLRFVKFDHRSFVLKVRRREYAFELARLNGGRVR